MSVDVSVIIVSYNARDLLEPCIASVQADAAREGAPSVEIIVVDNESSDDSVAFARERFPEVNTIEAGRNGGMAAGNNVGMLAANGRYFLLLNSDARLFPGALEAMVAAVGDVEETRVGMVGPLLRNVDGTLQRSARGFPTPWRLATEFWFLRKLAPRSRAFNALYRGDFDHSRAADMEWVSGAAMLVPRAVVDDVGLMNEAYFMFNEEVDWQWRMRERGWRVRFEPAAEVEHLGGGSTAQAWGRMYESQVTSHVRYLATNVGVGKAKRARRVIGSALLMRTVLWKLGALVPIGDRKRRAARAAAFAGGWRAVRQARPDDLTEPTIPSWHADSLQRSDPSPR